MRPGRDRNIIRPAVLAVSVLALVVGAAVAQEDPIKARQELMKSNGQQAALGAKMIKGEVPFDLAKAKASLPTSGNRRQRAGAVPGKFQDRW